MERDFIVLRRFFPGTIKSELIKPQHAIPRLFCLGRCKRPLTDALRTMDQSQIKSFDGKRTGCRQGDVTCHKSPNEHAEPAWFPGAVQPGDSCIGADADPLDGKKLPEAVCRKCRQRRCFGGKLLLEFVYFKEFTPEFFFQGNDGVMQRHVLLIQRCVFGVVGAAAQNQQGACEDDAPVAIFLGRNIEPHIPPPIRASPRPSRRPAGYAGTTFQFYRSGPSDLFSGGARSPPCTGASGSIRSSFLSMTP